MAHIIFYEKLGCGGNAKQKALLLAAGHELEIKSLLAEAWTRESLLAFLSPLPVSQWFNLSAPRIKSGQINLEQIDAESALPLLLAEPLLIRRPLMESAGQRKVGFVLEEVDAWVGLAGQYATEDELGCQGNAGQCAGHQHDAGSTDDGYSH